MSKTILKYEACAAMLKEVLAQYVPAKPSLFSATPRDHKQCAFYASACGLAEAAIKFAVASEGHSNWDAEKVSEQSKNPRWVAEQTREVLARMYRAHSDDKERFDDGR